MNEGLQGAFHQLPMLIVRAVVGESAAVGYAASLGHPALLNLGMNWWSPGHRHIPEFEIVN